MKKTLLSGVAFTAMVVLISCGGKTKEPEIKSPPPTNNKEQVTARDTNDTVVPPYYVPKEQALADISNYGKACRTSYGNFPLRAYTLQTYDLIRGLDITGCSVDTTHHLRGYIGLTESGEYKFYFVMAVGASLPDVPGHDSCFVVNGQEYVLDLNAPCPNTCDVTSAFYIAGQK